MPTPRLLVPLAIGCVTALACSDRSSKPVEPDRGAKGDHIGDAPTCEPAQMMLIVDKSSSMQTGSINGRTKWAIATEAIGSVTAEFDTSIETGLMVFPAPSQCAPGDVMVPPALGSRQDIALHLAAPPPDTGNWTPMAQTLDAAASAPEVVTGRMGRYAVLITDGWQWCSPYDPDTRFTPVEAVARLQDKGVTTYVVGFGASVDALTLNQMAVVAGTSRAGCNPAGASPDAGNACYFQADSPFELHAALRQIAAIASAEVCDGLDNDCDGEVDENLMRSCATACGAGGETCVNGSWVGCTAPPVGTDVCDGVDNDCDGLTDPGCECLPGESRPCGNQQSAGMCEPGVQICLANGQWGDCQGEVFPSIEVCDDVDNDCNGVVDDPPVNEICNNVDDDCDGKVNESLTRRCTTACGNGEETCDAGNWVGCNAPPVLEDVCDGADNDCDGTTDNGCECLPGEQRPCGDSEVGECSYGTQTCAPDGTWGDCQDDVGSSTEVCDDLDNDCDGTVDEWPDGQVPQHDDVTPPSPCPLGDDEREDPVTNDNPPIPERPENPTTGGGTTPPPTDKPSTGGCSTGGGGAGAGWAVLALLLGMCISRRRRMSPR